MTRLTNYLVGTITLCSWAWAAPRAPDQQVIDSPSSTIHDALLENSVITDVLDDFTPTHSLSLSYPKAHESVLLGNDIPVSSVSSPPAFEFHALASSASEKSSKPTADTVYTLILTDPDAKSRSNPKWSEMCHWIVTNITLPTHSLHHKTFDPSSSSSMDELKSYLPPTPPPKTGKHRYVFVLLAGSKEDAGELKAPKKRKHWGYKKVRHGVRDWAEEWGLEVVGANFFFAEDEKQ